MAAAPATARKAPRGRIGRPAAPLRMKWWGRSGRGGARVARTSRPDDWEPDWGSGLPPPAWTPPPRRRRRRRKTQAWNIRAGGGGRRGKGGDGAMGDPVVRPAHMVKRSCDVDRWVHAWCTDGVARVSVRVEESGGRFLMIAIRWGQRGSGNGSGGPCYDDGVGHRARASIRPRPIVGLRLKRQSPCVC